MPAPPDARSLLAALGEGLRPDDRRAIARADYGHGAEANARALARLAAGDLAALAPLEGGLREVLELTRWDEIAPDAPDARPRHARRLFACVALLIAAADPADRGRTHSICDTAVIAADSVLDALPERRADLTSLLVQLRRGWDPEDLEARFLDLARLPLLAAPPPDPAAVAAALDAVERELARDDAQGWHAPIDPAERYAAVLGPDSLRRALWAARLDDALARLRADDRGAEAAARLEALARGRSTPRD